MPPIEWKIAGASVTGFSHRLDDKPCEDSHVISILHNNWLIGVVSDGAGSASRSLEGSRTLCEGMATQLNSKLGDIDQQTDCQLNEAAVRAWVEEAIEEVRGRLTSLATDTDGSLAQFHATLVGVVAGSSGGIFFHIGDGAGCAACCADLSVSILSKPENGEYSNETYFITQDDWRDHLRLTSFGPQYDLVTLMSDGVTPFALAEGASGLFSAFFDPLSRFLAKHDRDAGERALAATLDRDAVRSITGDDKTLIWALKVNADG